MSNNLVIVESPTKARTLAQFLGDKYQITASMGHIRDLPKSDFGVDVQHDFEPLYVVPRAKRKTVGQLEKQAREVSHLYLATDPDREGEAIAWHIVQLLNSKGQIKNQKIDRVVFHEITKEAVKEAFAAPRDINLNLVDAQQARRVLDRIVGYRLSPLLWRKIRRGLSAGRVQSVAVKLIVDREREIEKFKSREYWTIEVELAKAAEAGTFIALLIEKDGKKISLANESEAKTVESDLRAASYKIAKIAQKQVKKYPAPPFTTSTLQQTAANRLGFSAKKIMAVAQELYERGLITYMRTDSVNLADTAIANIHSYIDQNFGRNYLPTSPRKYRIKSKVAQEAHEAVRPTDVTLTADRLPSTDRDQRRLYDLIWRRTVACQMAEAVMDQKTVDVLAQTAKAAHILRATGTTTVFDGWHKIFEIKNGEVETEERVLPELKEGEILKLLNLASEQHFTQPPDRYTEATLIKTLEINGIGRPSTYAPIISTILERQYVERIERKFQPTNLGIAVNDFLVANFADIVDLSFTAEMEEELDEVARGEREWRPMMTEFYGPFEKQLVKVENEAKRVQIQVEETDEKCELCGRPLVIRIGRYGKFLACSGFPECKNTKALVEKIGALCPKDGGNIIVRKTKKGRSCYGGSNWPKCDFASWVKPQAKANEQNTEAAAS